MPQNGSPSGTTDSRVDARSVSDRLPSFLHGSHRFRPTGGGGVFLVVVSTAVSLVAGGVLPDSMRIRWSLGTYYGPESAPTGLVLAAVPVAIVVVVGGARVLADAFERREQVYKTRPVYEFCTLAVLLSLVLIQVTLVVANLV